MLLDDRILALLEQYETLRACGEPPTADELCRDCPELLAALRENIALLDSFKRYTTSPEDQSAIPSIPGYEILGELGRGGMSVVYKARQVQLNRVVALKMLLHAGHVTAAQRERFLGEAKAIAEINHPGVVQVYDYGTHEGVAYFALELCPGGNLAEYLAGKPLPPHEAARLVEQLARAAHAAHERGIVHRDLKPSNVLLSRSAGVPPATSPASPVAGETPALRAQPVPRLTDFGLARRLDGDGKLTHTGDVLGTPSYMAPEQVRASKDAGPLADVYSLGAILYECLTGRPPFLTATPMQTLALILDADPATPRTLNAGVPRDYETITLKCLHKHPARRYASAQALADDLRRLLNNEPIHARPTGPITRTLKWARRRPAATLAVVALLLGVTAALTAAFAGVAYLDHRLALRTTELQSQREAQERIRNRDSYLSGLRQASLLQAAGEVDAVRQQLAKAVPEGGDTPTNFAYRFLRAWSDRGEVIWQTGIPTTQLAFAPGGLTLAIACGDGTIELRHAHTGRLVERLTFVKDSVLAIAFSPDGDLLAGLSSKGILTVRQLSTSKILWEKSLEGPYTRACVTFSPNGDLLAIAPNHRHYYCFQSRTGNAFNALHPQHLDIVPFEFSLANDGTISLIYPRNTRVFDGKEALRILPTGDAHAGCFAGLYLATVDSAGVLRLFDRRTGFALGEVRSVGLGARCVAGSPDGGLFAVGNQDGSVRLIERATGRFLVFRGFSGGVSSVAFSNDGRRFAALDSRGLVRVLDVVSPLAACPLEAPVTLAGPLCYSPDGTTLAAVDSQGKLHLLSGANGDGPVRQCALIPTTHLGGILAVAYSPDGKRLATAGGDGRVEVHDAEGRLLWHWPKDGDTVSHSTRLLAWSRDGKYLAAGGTAVTVLADGKVRDSLGISGRIVSGMDWSGDGALFLSGEVGVNRWEPGSGKLPTPWIHGTITAGLAISPDGQNLCTLVGGDWITASTAEPAQRMPRSAGVLRYTALQYFRDGRGVVVFEPEHGEGVGGKNFRKPGDSFYYEAFLEGPSHITARPAGGLAAASASDGLWILEPQKSGRSRQVFGTPPYRVHQLAFSRDSKSLFTLGRRAPSKFWLSSNGSYSHNSVTSDVSVLQRWEIGAVRPVLGEVIPSSTCNAPAHSMALSPDGKVLAVGAGATRLLRLGADTKSKRATTTAFASSVVATVWTTMQLARHIDPMRDPHYEEAPIRAVAWSPDGKWLATRSRAAKSLGLVKPGATFDINKMPVYMHGLLQLWPADGSPPLLLTDDLREASPPVFTSQGPEYNLGNTALAFSPDGELLALGEGSQVLLWSVSKRRQVRALNGHDGNVHAIAFSTDPNERTLFSAGADGRILVWDTDAEKPKRILTGHGGRVWALAVSPDGKTLASGGEDRAIRLWELPSGEELIAIQGHRHPVCALAFSPDGMTLASGGGSRQVGEVLLWRTR